MKKVLLIEDNKDNRETTAEILEIAEFEVETAKNGKEGIERVKTFRPDLIICDIMMPELDGFGVLHILSKKIETASIPFIFLTAKSEKTDLRKGMNLGADDYLTKPYDSMELLDAVETRLKKNEVLQKKFTLDINGLNNFISEASKNTELNDLAKDRLTRKYPKNRFLFLEGDPAHIFYFIHSGKVKTFKGNNDGKEFVTGIHEAGSFIGYLPLLGTVNVHNETAKVMEDAEICSIQKDDLLKLLHRNTNVSQKFIKMLSKDLMDREDELVRIAYDSVRQRVAQALLNLHNNTEKSQSLDTIGITREDLAGIIGIAKETVTRTLSEFKSEGIIEIDRKLIVLKNTDLLVKATL